MTRFVKIKPGHSLDEHFNLSTALRQMDDKLSSVIDPVFKNYSPNGRENRAVINLRKAIQHTRSVMEDAAYRENTDNSGGIKLLYRGGR